MWVFDSIVDTIQERTQASGKQVFATRLLYKDQDDNKQETCMTTYFYDKEPQEQEIIERIEKITETLNPFVDPVEVAKIQDIQEVQTFVADIINLGVTKEDIIKSVKEPNIIQQFFSKEGVRILYSDKSEKFFPYETDKEGNQFINLEEPKESTPPEAEVIK